MSQGKGKVSSVGFFCNSIFAANPVTGLLFFCLIAIGYLYIDNKTTLTNQIVALQEEVIVLRSDYKKLNDKFIETLQDINE